MDKYVLAVSGGIDSVVLLDILSRHSGIEIIVAHFDHGIRKNSNIDAIFVAGLAKKYNLKFETRREELGEDASEELARARRYKFLRSVAKKHGAKLVTAHHADDIIETIAINLVRGTGWRGLAVLDSDILRLLTKLTKRDIYDYARENGLTWREDSTNNEEKYLRNRVRQKTAELKSEHKEKLLKLWENQKKIKKDIDQELMKLVGDGPSFSRYFFTNIDEKLALECLRHAVKGRLTRPQLIKALHAIKTSMPYKIFHAGGGVEINFTSRNFMIELIK